MITCVVDSREQDLLRDLRSFEELTIESEMLTIGDLIIYDVNKEEKHPLLLIERKTVRDLIQSLRDRRFHDQRNRWAQFQVDHPKCKVSVWLEGDLLSATMDDGLRATLVNTLFRLQSIHGVLVEKVRNRDQFIKTLRMVADKFSKEPYHLVDHVTQHQVVSPVALEMKKYKKTCDKPSEKFWLCALAGIPGVTLSAAEHIANEFSSFQDFFTQVIDSDNIGHITEKIANVVHKKRRIGNALAEKIVSHLVDVSNDNSPVESTTLTTS